MGRISDKMKVMKNIGIIAFVVAMVFVCAGCPKTDFATENEGLAVSYTWELVAPPLKASTPVLNQYFGYAVDISDNFAVVGAWGNDSVYIFKNNGGVWNQMPVLVKSGELFGWSVAISGNYIVVGAPGYVGGGTAYLYEYDGSSWVVPAGLTSSSGRLNCPSVAGNNAGFSVDIDGNYIAVGNPANTSSAGVVYVFYKDEGSANTWARQVTLASTVSGCEFGSSVSISGTNLVGGAPSDDVTFNNSGAFYFSTRSGVSSWSALSLSFRIKTSTPVASGRFGTSIGVYGNTIIAGEMGTGKAYLFTLNGSSCSQTAVVTSSDSSAGDEFGYAVSITGLFCAVGAHLHDTGAANSGTGYILYNDRTVIKEVLVTKASPIADDKLGEAISISSNYAIIGIPYDDETQSDSGKVLIYRKKTLTKN